MASLSSLLGRDRRKAPSRNPFADFAARFRPNVKASPTLIIEKQSPREVSPYLKNVLGADASALTVDWTDPYRPVTSSNLSGIAYDAARRVMLIQFHGKHVYRYDGVPRWEFLNLWTAASKGQTFWYDIRKLDKYAYTKLS